MREELQGRGPSLSRLQDGSYLYINCIPPNPLAAFMWRKPLNSAVLVAATHRKLGKVFDGTSTQVVDYMINKWKAKINGERLYNVKDLPGKGGEENRGKKTL